MDFELESKVFGLFQQTLKTSLDPHGQPLSALHPDDLEARKQADLSKERIFTRLHEIRLRDPDRFGKIYSILVRNHSADLMEKEENDMLRKNEGFEIDHTVVTEGSVNAWSNVNALMGGIAMEDKMDWEWENEDNQLGFGELYGNKVWSEERSIQNQLDNPEYQENLIYSLDPLDVITQDYDKDKLLQYYFNSVNKKFNEQEEVDFVKKKKCRNRCIFCSAESHLYPLEPMNVPLLTKFMSTSGTILPRRVNGLCRKMQSKITRTIKYSRALGLFSYKHGRFTIRNPAHVEDEKIFDPEDSSGEPMEKEPDYENDGEEEEKDYREGMEEYPDEGMIEESYLTEDTEGLEKKYALK